jgi:hypothetical protein
MKISKVKNWLKGEKDMSINFYDMWKNMGAFSGKSEERNIEFTKKTEELAAYLSIRSETGSELLSNIIFAIVVRSYFVHDYIFESCPGVVVFVENHKFMIAEIAAADGPEVDAEAEFCAKMAESICRLKI